MKKILATLTILIASLGFCLAQVMIPDWQTLDLKGDVKTLITSSFKTKTQGDSTVAGEKTRARQTYTYSSSEKITFNEDGYIQSATGSDVNGRTTDFLTFKYNKKRFMDETLHYGHDKSLKEIKTYKYDDYGGLVLIRLYGKDKYMINKTTFKMDRMGNVVELKQSNTEKKQLNSRKFAYDENNNCISTMIFNPKNKLILTLVSEYDKNNSLAKNTTLDINRKPSTVSTFTYKYDNLGNWIERVESKNGEPFVVTVRDIFFHNDK